MTQAVYDTGQLTSVQGYKYRVQCESLLLSSYLDIQHIFQVERAEREDDPGSGGGMFLNFILSLGHAHNYLN